MSGGTRRGGSNTAPPPKITRRDLLITLNAVAGVTADAVARVMERLPPTGPGDDGDDVSQRWHPGAPTLASCGLPESVATELWSKLRAGYSTREADRVAALGGWILVRGEPGYPEALETIADPPVVLYGRGTLPGPGRTAIAIVGARRASRYGLAQAERFAYLLGALGAVVVSGLARGIDGAAHTGCLDAGGATVAVLGSGLDVDYPREHGGLARRIALGGGAIVSEFPLGSPPLAWHFPRRNRIIAGLAAAVIVVEAAARSGSLVTARLALDAGREVMAIPGPVDAAGSAGPHQLIRDGAILVGGIDDVVSALPTLVADVARLGAVRPESSPGEPAPFAPGRGSPGDRDHGHGGDPERARVLAALTDDPLPLDQVATASQLPLPRVMALLCLMSLAGIVVEHPGQRYSRPRWAA